MNKSSYLAALLVCQMLISVASAVAQNSGGRQPLELSNAVLPTPSKNALLDPRIFSPEFYRKVKSRPWPYDRSGSDLPADKFGFAPTDGQFKGVRTLGQMVKHLSATNYILNAAALGEKPSADAGDEIGPESVRTKARPQISRPPDSGRHARENALVPLRRELVASYGMNCSLYSSRCILLRSASDRLRSLETKDPDQRLACVIEIIELGALRYVFTEQMVAYRRVS